MSTEAQRARDWHHRAQMVICDVVAPWAHGTVVRATRYPTYYDFNVVCVHDEPELSAASLIAFADEALDGLDHRRVDFDRADVAETLAAGFATAGWDTLRRVVMRHRGSRPGAPAGVARVDYDAAEHLRMAWLREDFPDLDFSGFPAVAKEVALRLGTETYAVHGDDGDAIGFAEVQRDGTSAEVRRVYVDAAHRGRGLGTLLTQAAMHAAGDADDLWILADAQGRPQRLYARLGFFPTWWTVHFQRLGCRA